MPSSESTPAESSASIEAGDGPGRDTTATESDDAGVVSWVALPDRQSDPYFLAVRHLLAGTLGAVLLVVVGFLAFVVTRSVVDPSNDVLLLLVTLALVGGPVSLLYVLIAADVGSERERRLFSPDLSWLRLRWLLPGLIAGAGLLGGLGLLVGPLLLLFVPFGFALLVSAVDSRYTVGRLDTEARTLVFYTGKLAREYAEATPRVTATGEVPAFDTDDRNRRKADLSSLAGTDRYRIGDYAVFRLRFHDRAWLHNRPRLLVVPASAGDEVESALSAVTATNDWVPGEGLDRDVRLVLGALGLTFLGAVGLFALVAGGEPAVLYYAGATLGLLGLGMVVAALFG